MIRASVTLCTHNPRLHYLTRVLEALRAQTLPTSNWELLLIDNASKEPVGGKVDLTWHPHGRLIQEPVLGLTPARLRGITEARAELLVLVDDDNLLRADYLANAIHIANENPDVGAWGGTIRLEFEQAPPDWTRPYWRFLTVREVTRDATGITPVFERDLTPYGAGLCLRRPVGLAYRERLATSPLRQALDRKGTALSSAGDIDLALTACDLGRPTGLFQRLELMHLIPPERLAPDYLLRLCEGLARSSMLLRLIRGAGVRRLPRGFAYWLKLGYDCLRKSGHERTIFLAHARGEREGFRLFTKNTRLDQVSVTNS